MSKTKSRASRNRKTEADRSPDKAASKPPTLPDVRPEDKLPETPQQRRLWLLPTPSQGSPPPYRRLRVYPFDPSTSTSLSTVEVNEVTLRIPWEAKLPADLEPDVVYREPHDLQPGPVGEYLEVIDFDPASDCYYEPVNLNDPALLAQDGLTPSEGNPQFHQQMVYAVAMNTIHCFERATGRRVQWASRVRKKEEMTPDEQARNEPRDLFVRRLRLYPHALREANAYYSIEKKALLFGYFTAAAKRRTCCRVF